ncbi:hypothetical protein [Candidatus Poriferisodalis sp.]|uniref:hypothetical protein n=1 Tax=Candidatus Poriferisodalis sp. TaxID=3101277 RepID=UPI003B021E38
MSVTSAASVAWVRSAALWLGPPAAWGDASITAGVLWLAVLIAALWAGAAVFGLLVSAVAALGAWQAASLPGTLDAAPRSPRLPSGAAAVVGDPRFRLPAAALAGAVGLAGIFDTRLAGVVLGTAVIASFIVAGSLRGDRAATDAARSQPVTQPRVLARAGQLVRCWMQVGAAAACAAAVARYSSGAALVLVAAAASYDAGAYVTAAERPPGLRGPLVGAVAAAAAVFALTGLSVPPFAPSDVSRYGVIAVLTLPLGPALARAATVPAVPPDTRLSDGWSSARSAAADPAARGHRAGFAPMRPRAGTPWAVRRLDSLSITALVWMWGLGLLTI